MGLPVRLFEVAAGELEGGLDVEIALAHPQLVKGDASGMAEQPGGLVIERRDAVLERSDTEGDPECPAL